MILYVTRDQWFSFGQAVKVIRTKIRTKMSRGNLIKMLKIKTNSEVEIQEKQVEGNSIKRCINSGEF